MKMTAAVDWQNGIWKNGRIKHSGRCWRIMIVPDWAPIRKFASVMEDTPEECYGSTLELLRSADLRIVNLECAIDGNTPVLKGGPNLSGHRSHLRCLACGGFEVATLANNHVFDFGQEGFRKTAEALKECGILHFGAGLNRQDAEAPLILHLGNLKIGLTGFTEGHDLSAATDDSPGVAGWNPERVLHTIRELRRQCNIVLVIPHAGIEYCAYPPRYCIDAYRRLAMAKPDAIVAHHPHVPQGIEIYHGVPIFYSLGNFLFYQETNLFHRKHGFMLELEVSESGLAGFRIHPYQITDKGCDLLPKERRSGFFSLLQALSRPFAGNPYEGYYGVLRERWNSGFAGNEFEKVVRFFQNDPLQAAALLRNRMTTLQHTGLYVPMFDRVVRGIIDEAPDWATAMEHEFMNRTLHAAGCGRW